MALPTPGAGRHGLVSFRLFGIPVTIHASFLVIVLLLGYRGDDPTDPTDQPIAGALIWLAIVVVSVIAHELGHAFAARPVGGEPRIDLYMMAGLTTWQPGRSGRGRRVFVAVAGPAAGVLLGMAILLAYALLTPESATLDRALQEAVYVNLAWGLLNLLPMLPLDGGQVVLALMPGRDELARVRRASYASLGVAVAVMLAALAAGAIVAAFLVLFFGAGNLQRVVALRKGDDPATNVVARAELALQGGDPEQALRLLGAGVPEAHRMPAAILTAAALLRLGRHRDAQHVLLDLPAGAVEPVFEAAVLWANGQEQLARERLGPALANEPPEWAVRELVLLLRRLDVDVVGVVGAVTGRPAAGVLHALYATGDYAAAAAWGERALATGATDPVVAYDTACAYARAGDAERAVRAAGYAAQLGWADVAYADGDDDLAGVRAHPEWPAIRAAMAANAGLGASSRGR